MVGVADGAFAFTPPFPEDFVAVFFTAFGAVFFAAGFGAAGTGFIFAAAGFLFAIATGFRSGCRVSLRAAFRLRGLRPGGGLLRRSARSPGQHADDIGLNGPRRYLQILFRGEHKELRLRHLFKFGL